MGSIPSNFSEIAYKRSIANDKKVAYNQKIQEFAGGLGINAGTLSEPVLSGVVDGNKMVVRQFGKSDEPVGFVWDRFNNKVPIYATVGVETYLDVGEDGVIRPSKDHMPRYVRIRKPKDHSFEGNANDLAEEWCKMVNGITSDLPDIRTLPLINPEAKEAKDREDRLQDEIDDALIGIGRHEDAGHIVSRSTPDGSAEDIRKKLAAITVKKEDDSSEEEPNKLILSDENVKNIEDSSFVAALCDIINRAKQSKETTGHILSSIVRKY